MRAIVMCYTAHCHTFQVASVLMTLEVRQQEEHPFCKQHSATAATKDKGLNSKHVTAKVATLTGDIHKHESLDRGILRNPSNREVSKTTRRSEHHLI